MRFARLSAAAILVALVALVALPAFGQEEGDEGGEGGPTTTLPQGEGTGEVTVPDPAVPVVPETEAEVTPPWTSRYLIPTTLVLAVVAVIATALMYYVKVVRTRYRVVQ